MIILPYLSEILPQLKQIEQLTTILGIGGRIALDDRNIINFLFYRDQSLLALKIIDCFMTVSHIDTPCDLEEEINFHLHLFKTKIKEKTYRITKQTQLEIFL